MQIDEAFVARKNVIALHQEQGENLMFQKVQVKPKKRQYKKKNKKGNFKN